MKPETAIRPKLIHSIWVVMLLMVFGMPLPILGSPFSPDQIPIAYDGQIQTSIAYDGNSLSEFDYDFAAMLVSGEKERTTTGTTGLFADFAKFLAAEGGAKWGAQHGGDAHWQRLQQIANGMERKGWQDIRINRQQVDAPGNLVGRNRPDISGINPRTAQRHNIEIDTSPASSVRHRTTVNANDPNARNTFIVLPRQP